MSVRRALLNSLLLTAFSIFMVVGFIYTYGIAGVSFAAVLWLVYAAWIILRSTPKPITH